MDSSDEKFFESLVSEKAEAEEEFKEEYGVELAKAKSAVKQPVIKKDRPTSYDGAEGQLTVDVYENKNEIVVESAIAGVKPEDLEVHVTKDSVMIRGERNRVEEIKNENYLYQECYWGRFSRSIILPQEVDADSASVNFKNGILTVRLPKVERASSKKLKIRVE